MTLVTIRDVSIRFRGPSLLDEVNCRIESGQRIGLLGRNGSGKTTLMKIICGEVEPDHGEIVVAAHTKIALLPQDVPTQLSGATADIVAQGVQSGDDHPVPQWQADQDVKRILSRMELDGAARFETLSSGMKRRVLLARALVSNPDVLLLDEPTNHLDIDAIAWLEKFFERFDGTLVFVTHDRMFLRRIANRIVEIDRGHLFDWSCDYDTFLKRKEDTLAAEEKQNALFDKKLAEEEKWIRQGIRARRTRNEGRVRALEQMRRQRSDRREKTGNVRITIEQTRRSGNLVAEVDQISFAYGGQHIIRDFSTTIMRGDKIGVIGPNGVGKTTLLRILLGQLAPQSGKVRLGTNLDIAYFDQLREQLDEDRTVQDNVGDGYDTVGTENKKHIIGYLQDFLFSPERTRTLVRFLSGGERHRVLLAKLFAKPANVIVLDEPTNDLDAETLELLEERLVEFNGTVLLVSHDREFLNNVVTSTMAFEPDGLREYVGGYDDWLRQSTAASGQTLATVDKKKTAFATFAEAAQNDRSQNANGVRKLKYKEKLELDSLPSTIENLEREIAILHDAMARPDYYQQPGETIAQEQARLKTLDEQLAHTYARWQELDELAD